VRVKIDRGWTFKQAVDAVWMAYRGIGLESKGYRNSALMAWGNVLGRERALSEFDAFIESHGGSFDAAAKVIEFSARSLKKIRKHIASLPSSIAPTPAATRHRFVLDEQLAADEDRIVQYKEITTANVADAIKNVADEYAVAFLNSGGGRLFWGVRDKDRRVVGVKLLYADRDRVRQVVANKLSGIRPHLDPTTFRFEFHPVFDGEMPVPVWVIELVVPRADGLTVYWTEGDQVFVMLDGVRKRLQGPEIQVLIERKRRT
jgi:hypothetical protein